MTDNEVDPEVQMAVNVKDAEAQPSEAPAGELKKGALGTGGIVFLVVSAAAPLTVIAGVAPLAILIAGPAAPTAYLIAGAALVLFAIGFMAMTRYVRQTGGFYTYITHALGRVVGLGAGILALVSYNAMQIGLYGLFAVTSSALLQTVFGVTVPWWVLALVAIAAVWALGFFGIDVGAKVLGVLLTAETLILLIVGIAIAVKGGPEGFKFGMFDPTLVFTPQVGIVLGLALGAFLGFEATALYRAEARNPNTSIPRATYISIGFLTVFYTVLVWLFVQAFGETGVQAYIGENGITTFAFTTADQFLGQWASIAMYALIVTSVYAGLLAFHNTINRYAYSLARDGILPAALTRTRRDGSPHIAGLTQTILALLIVGAFAIAGADPYLQLLIWVNTPGVVGVLILQLLASVAVIVFFVRHRTLERKWYVLPAAILATLLLALFAVLIVINIDFLTGAGPVVNAIILLIVPVAFLVGVVLAVIYKRSRPAAYARIGGGEADE
ncbi:MAG: APC family permease [Pseudolysinimonas sp.]